MGARAKPAKGSKGGNFISEWFGHRVWPVVDANEASYTDQTLRRCPFLSAAIGAEKICIKTSGRTDPTGVCTISSDSNGTRENWLACPYRTLDKDFTLLSEAIRLLFDIQVDTDIKIFSGEKIKIPSHQLELANAIKAGTRVFVFSADKLGGEVDLPETDGSPGSKVDVSVIEVLACDKEGCPTTFGKHLFYEIQTADFHGSPLHAVHELEKLCPRNSSDETFHERLGKDIEVCGQGVEGPNKSNVFKRTFYQMTLKVNIADHDECSGFVLIIPSSVWASWKTHLGNPKITKGVGKKRVLLATGEDAEKQLASCKSWIFVFDIDQTSKTTPHRLVITDMIAASTKALLENAFERVTQNIVAGGVVDTYRKTLSQRIQKAWSPVKTKPMRAVRQQEILTRPVAAERQKKRNDADPAT